MQEVVRIGILTTQDQKPLLVSAISHFPQEPNTDISFLIGEEMTLPHPEIQVLVTHKGVNKQNFSETLKAHPNVKWVHCLFTGVEHLFVPELVESDIKFTNAKNCFSESLGEFISFVMLYFSKKIPLFVKQKEQKLWKQTPIDVIKGKTLTIVGYGDIGADVAKKAKIGFDMKVIGVKKNPDSTSEEAKSYTDKILGTQQCEEALQVADYVVSILPGLESTFHFFDLSRFKQMKPSAIFISIGRGTVVKEEDLITALQEKVIRGAALDVFEKEPLSQESKLWDLQNLLLLPHNADYTTDHVDLSYEIFLKNLKTFMKGQEFESVVSKQKGY